MASESVMKVFPEVSKAIEESRMLDAWKMAQETGVSLWDWPEGEPLKQAGRLASSLGAARLSQAIHWKNWRLNREEPVRFYQALFTRARFAPLVKLSMEIDGYLRKHGDLKNAERADLLSFRARILHGQRDFESAEKLFAEVIRLVPDDSWQRAERSAFFAAADRYEEALEEARLAVKLAPHYRPAVIRCSDALIHLGKDDEALELLLKAHETSQQPAFAGALQVIYSEREDHERALWCLDEIERLSPLNEPHLKQWIEARRAQFHLLGGNLEAFLESADQAGEGHQKKAAKNFRERGGRGGIRKRLEVKFTRQHRMTCAPATLASLAAYWGRSHDHLAIAEEICDEGTPWHKERAWAEANGFLAREFRFTRENLHELIDRGVPFTLTTQWTTGAHLQACIGYDSRTDAVILRDPTERHFGEMLIENLLDSHPLAGPRGMVLLPAERGDLLADLSLADELVYESAHRLRSSFETHDRLKIESGVVELRAVAPGHLLTLEGELRAAEALEEWPRALAAVNQLLERLPRFESLLLTKAAILSRLRRTAEHRELLESVVAKPKAEAVFLSDLGELLSEDARELKMADYYLRRSLMRSGAESRVYQNLSRCRMKERKFEEAAILRRASACLAPNFEPYAAAYFESCRIIGKAKEGLAFLEKRTVELGRKNHGPWITYAQALESLNRSSDAAAILENAVALHPDDGDLQLHGGRLMVAWGPEFRDRGRALMEQSHGKVSEVDWLKESAEVAVILGERRTSLRLLKLLLERQPNEIWVWRALASQTAEEEGRAEAIKWLDEGTRRFPNFADLWALKAEWLAATPGGAMPALDRFLELSPKSVWGFRERALRFLDARDFESALADAVEALQLDPLDATSKWLHGLVLTKLRRIAEAAEEFRRAISISVDHPEAPGDLMALATDRESSIAELDRIEQEMRRQVSNGGIVLVFQRLAWRWMEPVDLLGKLRSFCRERPDLWQTWSALIEHALRMSLPLDAKMTAVKMTEMFPLMPRAWMDLAKVQQALGDLSAELEATGKALEISPSWDEAARLHADALERAGRISEAESILRHAISTDPLNAANSGFLADLLRRSGRAREGLDLLRPALEKSPFYAWGWDMAARWARADGRVDEIASDLESVTSQQQHRAGWWSLAADTWQTLGFPEKAVAAARRGTEIAPEDQEFREKLAWLLCESGKFPEALEICSPRPGEVRPPREIEGRRAWILMQTGQPVQAIAALRDLTEREPDYVWGLAELTGWMARREDWKGVLEIATRWARQVPQDSRALNFIGQAQEALENVPAAEEAYKKALAFSPENSFGGRRLLDLQMKSNRFEAAAQTLKQLQYYVPSVWLAADEIELALRMDRPTQGLELTDTLLNRADADFSVLKWVEKLFEDHASALDYYQLLRDRIKQGDVVAPGALAVSIGQISSNQFSTHAYKLVKKQKIGSPIRIAGWAQMLDLAAKLKQRPAVVAWSRKHREELTGNGELWRKTGEAFLTLQDFKHGLAWFADWRDRPEDVTFDTLLWVAAMSDSAPEHWRQAKEARAEALRLFPHATTSGAFRAGLAFQHAVDGELDEARRLLAEFEPGVIAEFYQNYAHAAEAILAAVDGDEKKCRQELTTAADFFAQIDQVIPSRVLRLTYKTVASHLRWARSRPGRLQRKWDLPFVPGIRFFKSSENLGIWTAVLVLIVFAKFCSREN